MVQNAGLRMLGAFKNQNLRNFSELCEEAGYPTDLGGYYLRQLVRAGYLEKGRRGEYLLAAKGRSYLTSAHTKLATTPRVHVLLITTLDSALFVLRRTQQPFLLRYEWPATSIGDGESLAQAIERLQERLAEVNRVRYCGVFRRTDYFNRKLFDDKIFLVYRAELSAPPAHKTVSNGEICRVTLPNLADLERASRSLLDIYNFSNSKDSVAEKVYDLTTADFERD